MPKPISRKDYQKKNLRNPFFPRRDGGYKSSKKSLIFLGVIFLTLIFVGLLFINKAEKFKISNITVQEVEFINDEEIKELVLLQLNKKRWLIFNQSNIFFFNKSQVEEKIKETYLLSDVKVKKKYFSGIEIDLQSDNSGLIWANNTNQFYLDLDGKITKQIDSENLYISGGENGDNIIRSGFSASKYPLVKDLSNREVLVGENILSEDTVIFVLELTNELKNKADFDISYYEINRPAADDITLITQEGWSIKFSLTNSVSSQINSLFTILRQRVVDRSKLQYIDLRFGEKIFWQ